MRDHKIIRFIPLLAILTLLLGIFLDLYGLIDIRERGIDDIDIGLGLRPGGFLNPNQTASLSLVWLYVALESDLFLGLIYT